MKVFFTASYDGKKYYQKYYDIIKEAISSTGAKLISPEVTREYQDAFRPENIKKLGDPDGVHYEFIRQGIATADAVIVEASYEDFRVGHEATLAIVYKKPVLCLAFNKNFGHLIRHEFFHGEQYTEGNLQILVYDFISKVSKSLLSKRKQDLTIHHKKTLLSRSSKSVAVLGSMNIDLVTKVPYIPKANEVVISDGLKLLPGGKATNAAIGLSRLGTSVSFLGKVGNDSFGEAVLDVFTKEGMNTDFIDTDSFVPTGTVMVNVDAQGKNTIIVNEDANIRINKKTITDFLKRIDDHSLHIDLFYTTLEPLSEIVAYAIDEFHTRNIPIFVDAAPMARPMSPALYSSIDFLSCNEFEASAMSGVTVHDVETANKAALVLRKKGANTVIITLGHLGSVLLPQGKSETLYFPGLHVLVVDETTAGDAYRAAFVSEFLEGVTLSDAVKFANFVGAYAVTKLGSYESLPTRHELEFLKVFDK